MSESKEVKDKRTAAAPKVAADAPHPPAPMKKIAEPTPKAAVTASQPLVPVEKIAEPAPVPAAIEEIAATAVPRPVRRSTQNASEQMLSTYRATLASFGDSQRAVANGVKAMALEVSGLTQAALTDAGDSAAAIIRARNLSDAVEVQFGFARRSIAALIAGSARLSEIGTQLAADAARPVVAPLCGSAQAD